MRSALRRCVSRSADSRFSSLWKGRLIADHRYEAPTRPVTEPTVARRSSLPVLRVVDSDFFATEAKLSSDPAIQREGRGPRRYSVPPASKYATSSDAAMRARTRRLKTTTTS